MSAGAVAVVTGASRGIGRHVAEALEAAGYVVERGSTTVAQVTDRWAVAAWVGGIVARRGRIDLLVNNAGVIDAGVDILDSDPDDWWRTMEVNVLGTYLMTWVVGRQMRDAGGGRIVNLSALVRHCSRAASRRRTTRARRHWRGSPALPTSPGRRMPSAPSTCHQAWSVPA